jgi:hypothetical protein
MPETWMGTKGAAMEVTVQRQMNWTRGTRVLKRLMVAEHYECFASQVAVNPLFPSAGALLALKLSRCQRLLQSSGAVRS